MQVRGRRRGHRRQNAERIPAAKMSGNGSGPQLQGRGYKHHDNWVRRGGLYTEATGNERVGLSVCATSGRLVRKPRP